jgi:hypothetical protein
MNGFDLKLKEGRARRTNPSARVGARDSPAWREQVALGAKQHGEEGAAATTQWRERGGGGDASVEGWRRNENSTRSHLRRRGLERER